MIAKVRMIVDKVMYVVLIIIGDPDRSRCCEQPSHKIRQRCNLFDAPSYLAASPVRLAVVISE
jgi:hypothetical protein